MILDSNRGPHPVINRQHTRADLQEQMCFAGRSGHLLLIDHAVSKVCFTLNSTGVVERARIVMGTFLRCGNSPRHTWRVVLTAFFKSSRVSYGISENVSSCICLPSFHLSLEGHPHECISPNLIHAPANATIFITSVSRCAQHGQ